MFSNKKRKVLGFAEPLVKVLIAEAKHHGFRERQIFSIPATSLFLMGAVAECEVIVTNSPPTPEVFRWVYSKLFKKHCPFTYAEMTKKVEFYSEDLELMENYKNGRIFVMLHGDKTSYGYTELLREKTVIDATNLSPGSEADLKDCYLKIHFISKLSTK